MKMIIYNIFFIIFGGLAISSVIYNEIVVFASFFLVSIWFPYFDDLHNYNFWVRSKNTDYYNYYNYASNEDYTNPLWVGNKLHKHEKLTFFLSKYKVFLFFCQ